MANVAISLHFRSKSMNTTCGDFTFSEGTDIQPAILLKTDLFRRCSSKIQVLCGLTSNRVLYVPHSPMCFVGLIVPEFSYSTLETVTERYPRDVWVLLQAFLQHSVSASVFAVLDKNLLVSSSLTRISVLQRMSLLKIDPAFR